MAASSPLGASLVWNTTPNEPLPTILHCVYCISRVSPPIRKFEKPAGRVLEDMLMKAQGLECSEEWLLSRVRWTRLEDLMTE